MEMTIRKAQKVDADTLAELAIQMWSGHTVSELKEKFEEITQNENAVCFIKYIETKAVGFAQCQLRTDYVEGTRSSPVGYLEGIFVEAEHRNSGYAKELLRECEKWAKEKGCTEFASDCELNNDDSFSFHKAMGFEEANRIICFRKDI